MEWVYGLALLEGFVPKRVLFLMRLAVGRSMQASSHSNLECLLSSWLTVLYQTCISDSSPTVAPWMMLPRSGHLKHTETGPPLLKIGHPFLHCIA